MRRICKDLLISFCIGFVIPLCILYGLSRVHDVSSPPVETFLEVQPADRSPILLLKNGKLVNMNADEYLTCVLLAEMPAEFETEALKVQAIVARTFLKKAEKTGGKHGEGMVCTDSKCCQGFLSTEEYLLCGGTLEEIQKMEQAVRTTDGIVITYQGELIEATYFSSAGGSTEDAAQVWGSSYPYLVATESPDGEICMEEEKHFSKEELETLLKIQLVGNAESWFSEWHYTDGGGVSSVLIGNIKFDGQYLRKVLNLRSTLFYVTAANDTAILHTKGYGHRVGLSQYGADALAIQGKRYDEIIQYYYPGTALRVQ